MLQALATPGRRVRLRAMNITAKPARLKMFMPNKRSLVSIAGACPRNRCHCERSDAISFEFALCPRDCFVAPLLAMTKRILLLARQAPAQRLRIDRRPHLGVVVEIDIDVP